MDLFDQESKETFLMLINLSQKATQLPIPVQFAPLSDKKGQKEVGGWRLLNNFYVNCLHVKHDEEIADDSKIYQTFKVGKKLKVSIVALIIVPYKTVIGICFPDQSIQ